MSAIDDGQTSVENMRAQRLARARIDAQLQRIFTELFKNYLLYGVVVLDDKKQKEIVRAIEAKVNFPVVKVP